MREQIAACFGFWLQTISIAIAAHVATAAAAAAAPLSIGPDKDKRSLASFPSLSAEERKKSQGKLWLAFRRPPTMTPSVMSYLARQAATSSVFKFNGHYYERARTGMSKAFCNSLYLYLSFSFSARLASQLDGAHLSGPA